MLNDDPKNNIVALIIVISFFVTSGPVKAFSLLQQISNIMLIADFLLKTVQPVKVLRCLSCYSAKSKPVNLYAQISSS
jgi:hypothetical protein